MFYQIFPLFFLREIILQPTRSQGSFSPCPPAKAKAQSKQTGSSYGVSSNQIIHTHDLPSSLARRGRVTPPPGTMASFLSLRLPTPSPPTATSSPFFPNPLVRSGRCSTPSSTLVARVAGSAAGAPSPLFNPRGDPFLSTLAAASPEQLVAAAGGERRGEDHLPFLEIFQNAKLMSSPAQVIWCFRAHFLRACMGSSNGAAVL